MALPVIGATFVGSIITGLTLFFATRIPVILATLGITAAVYIGLDVFTGQLIDGVRSALQSAVPISIGGNTIDAVGLIAAAGFFDAANIILSGFVSVAGVKSAKLYFAAVKP